MSHKPITFAGSFSMAGTEGTNEYVGVVESSVGRLGYRPLCDGRVRVRLEPTEGRADRIAAVLTPQNGWKQPNDGQNRFSIVACPGDELWTAFSDAYGVVKRGRRPAPQYTLAAADVENVLRGSAG